MEVCGGIIAALCLPALVPPLPVPFPLVTLWQKKEVRGTKWFAKLDAYPSRFGAGQGGEVKQRGIKSRPALAPPLALPRGPLALVVAGQPVPPTHNLNPLLST